MQHVKSLSLNLGKGARKVNDPMEFSVTVDDLDLNRYFSPLMISKYFLIWSGAAVFLFASFTVEAKVKKEIRAHFSGIEMELPPQANFALDLRPDPIAVGRVSWYGPGFHGRRTASGERYNMHDFTCASRDLPFGTKLELTNLDNGEKVVVRVNDRGPFYKKRILDLSYAAAKKLGFYGKGETQVELRLLPEGMAALNLSVEAIH
jgi:rare lipoprotein A (RlpA)-like double-psi beta-barrel protein